MGISKKVGRADALFPELVDNNPKALLCKEIARGKHDTELILVHHLNEFALPFIESLTEGYKVRKIVGIPYSAVQSVVNELCNDFEVVVPDSLGDIKEIVRKEVLSSKENVIIEEIGGYTSGIAEILDKRANVLGIVEDTNQGHWLWEKAILKRLPVISIAQSKLKRVEDSYVARAIIYNTERFLEENNLPSLEDQRILLLGYGNLGSHVAGYLEGHCKSLIVYDTDPIRLISASGKHRVSPSFSKADIVLAVTGNPNHSIKINDIEGLKSGVFLVSGTSKRVEFDLEAFENHAYKVEYGEDVWTYFIKNRRIEVVNKGEPINWRYSSSLPSKILDLVYASIVYGINLLDDRLVKPGLNEISEEDQERIAKMYLSVYKVG